VVRITEARQAPPPVDTPRGPAAQSTAAEHNAKPQLGEKRVHLQASWQGQVMEWLKGLTGIAAIAGAVIALLQLAQLAASRDDDRFDRAVSRIGSDRPGERLAGVSGLQLFLNPKHVPGLQWLLNRKHVFRQRATLLFLVNAAAVEPDDTVRGAILDTFSSLGQYGVSQGALDETLRTARDRNRGILEVFQARFRERLDEDDRALFEKGNDEVWLGKLSRAERAPLTATAAIIAALIRGGAHTENLSGLYCVSCDFSAEASTVDLSGCNFDRSYLRDASFRKVKLQRASFDASYLMRTDFTNADLREAKLTGPPLLDPPVQAILVRKALYGIYGPIFESADLSGADFTGSALFGFYWTEIHGVGYFPQFSGANLRGANLRSFRLFTAVPRRMRTEDPGARAVPDAVLPFKFEAVGSWNIPVKGWTEEDYLIRTYQVGEGFELTGEIPRGMWLSVEAGLKSLLSAKNLSEAQMPDGLRHILNEISAAPPRPITVPAPSSASPTKPAR
jgi:uncharacterized protein YjbI with pentapeptide repeats